MDGLHLFSYTQLWLLGSPVMGAGLCCWLLTEAWGQHLVDQVSGISFLRVKKFFLLD